MPKTDKELTSEIVCTFIQVWSQRPSNASVNTNDLLDLIKNVYKVVSELPPEKH